MEIEASMQRAGSLKRGRSMEVSSATIASALAGVPAATAVRGWQADANTAADLLADELAGHQLMRGSSLKKRRSLELSKWNTLDALDQALLLEQQQAGVLATNEQVLQVVPRGIDLLRATSTPAQLTLERQQPVTPHSNNASPLARKAPLPAGGAAYAAQQQARRAAVPPSNAPHDAVARWQQQAMVQQRAQAKWQAQQQQQPAQWPVQPAQPVQAAVRQPAASAEAMHALQTGILPVTAAQPLHLRWAALCSCVLFVLLLLVLVPCLWLLWTALACMCLSSCPPRRGPQFPSPNSHPSPCALTRSASDAMLAAFMEPSPRSPPPQPSSSGVTTDSGCLLPQQDTAGQPDPLGWDRGEGGRIATSTFSPLGGSQAAPAAVQGSAPAGAPGLGSLAGGKLQGGGSGDPEGVLISPFSLASHDLDTPGAGAAGRAAVQG